MLNVIFMYQLTNEVGLFEVLQKSITGITTDRRLQLLLVAFCFGAFFEGAAGFGTPVAVTAAIMMGLGFKPLAAAGLSLIANTAPVAYGALGTPIVVLAAVTGLDLQALSAMVGRQLPFFSVLVPFWLIWAFVGFRRMIEIWPAILVAGVSLRDPAVPGVELSRAVARRRDRRDRLDGRAHAVPQDLAPERGVDQHVARGRDACPTQRREASAVRHGFTRAQVIKAWTPWAILSVLVFLWGLPQIKTSAQRDLGAQVPDRGPAQPGGARAAGGAEAHAGSRRVRAQLAVGDRHGHPDRGDHCRPRDGTSRFRRWCRPTARR